MKLRIIAIGKDFEESGRRSILCQQVTHDELGFDMLGRQFHWEIDKSTLTPQMITKLQDICTNKTVVERPFRLCEVVRSNPNTGEVTHKVIAEPVE